MMLRQLLAIVIVTVLFSLQACDSDQQQDNTAKQSPTPTAVPKLEKAWELTGLMAPESVVYSPDKQILYVSNVNGGANDKDSNGFISKVSIDGNLLDLKWVEGMHAPKGLALSGDNLYVADIDELLVININEGKITQRYQAENAQFLNDVTATTNGNVFVSDMLTNTIYCLHDNKFGVWLQSDELNAPNGLHAEKDRIVIGTWGEMTDGFQTDIPGHLKAVKYSNKNISSLGNAESIGNLDGVEPYNNQYLVTDWMVGKLFLINPAENSISTLLELEQGMADHEWLEEKSLVILPMMMTGQLLAYRYQ